MTKRLPLSIYIPRCFSLAGLLSGGAAGFVIPKVPRVTVLLNRHALVASGCYIPPAESRLGWSDNMAGRLLFVAWPVFSVCFISGLFHWPTRRIPTFAGTYARQRWFRCATHWLARVAVPACRARAGRRSFRFTTNGVLVRLRCRRRRGKGCARAAIFGPAPTDDLAGRGEPSECRSQLTREKERPKPSFLSSLRYAESCTLKPPFSAR